MATHKSNPETWHLDSDSENRRIRLRDEGVLDPEV